MKYIRYKHKHASRVSLGILMFQQPWEMETLISGKLLMEMLAFHSFYKSNNIIRFYHGLQFVQPFLITQPVDIPTKNFDITGIESLCLLYSFIFSHVTWRSGHFPDRLLFITMDYVTDDRFHILGVLFNTMLVKIRFVVCKAKIVLHEV